MNTWTIDTSDQWIDALAGTSGFNVTAGEIVPVSGNVVFESRVHTFARKQRFEQLTFKQTPRWGETGWENAGNLGPLAEPSAAVFISPGENDYWYLAATTDSGNYQAWHSTDFVNWTGYGDVTGVNWVTTAEYADGNYYVYYDAPNDEDPHLIIDDDLSDAVSQKAGKVLEKASHGSDIAVFRDLDGTFHMIYEDWSAINAREHSWDAQYAGHASSPDGVTGFEPHEHPAPIDLRGEPTGETRTYMHPHNGEQSYEVHEGPLDAFGDFELVRVGDTYYLFADHHPENGEIGLGYWYTDDLDKHFTWGGEIRSGLHPDPSVGFANGEFIMFVQEHEDLASAGPWVEGVRVQAGVDSDGDGDIDTWTDWQAVSETYDRMAGFAKVFSRTPAAIDLSSLPEGYAFQFRFEVADATAVMDKVVLRSASMN